MKELLENKPATLSWVSLSTMMAVTSIHHIFRLGYDLLPISVILTVLPFLLMRWYQKSKSTFSLGIHTLYSMLMFVWFGFIDGFMDHVLKAIGLENTTFLPGGEAEVVETALALWSPQASNIFYEGTGVLAFIIGFFAMMHLINLIRSNLLFHRRGPLNIVRS